MENTRKRRKNQNIVLETKILQDIKRIKDCKKLSHDDLKLFYSEMINYYQPIIKGLGKNLYGYDSENDLFYTDYILDDDSFRTNLGAISNKLQSFYDTGCKYENTQNHSPIFQNTVSSQNNNSIDIKINVDMVYQNGEKIIDDITTLSDTEIAEIKTHLSELRNVVKRKGSKREKWNIAKKIFIFALDKGCDVALAFFPMMEFFR